MKLPSTQSTNCRLPLLLKPKAIVLGLEASNYPEAVEALVRRALAGDGRLYHKSSMIARAIFVRDAQGGTVLEGGVALPHVRVEALTEERTALGICAREFFTEGSQRLCVSIIFLCLRPVSVEGMGILSEAYKIFGNAKNVYRLRSCRSLPEVLSALGSKEA